MKTTNRRQSKNIEVAKVPVAEKSGRSEGWAQLRNAKGNRLGTDPITQAIRSAGAATDMGAKAGLYHMRSAAKRGKRVAHASH